MQDFPEQIRPKITYKNGVFAFGIIDNFGLAFQEPSIFSFSLSNSFYEVLPGKISAELTDLNEKTYHPCTFNDSKNEKEFNDLILTNMNCPDDKTFDLKGSYTEGSVQTLELDLFLCQNSTENNNSCKSYEEMSIFFKDKLFYLVYVDSVMHVQDYNKPFGENYQVIWKTVDIKLSKTININLEKVELITIDGAFISNLEKKETFLTEASELDFTLDEDKELPKFIILFNTSNKIKKIERSYQTITEAFAVLGGLYSILFICGKLLSSFEKDLYIARTIINHLYNFQQDITSDFKKTEVQQYIKNSEGDMLNTNKNLTSSKQNILNIEKIKSKEESLFPIISNDNNDIKIECKKIEKKILKGDSFVMPHHSSSFIEETKKENISPLYDESLSPKNENISPKNQNNGPEKNEIINIMTSNEKKINLKNTILLLESEDNSNLCDFKTRSKSIKSKTSFFRRKTKKLEEFNDQKLNFEKFLNFKDKTNSIDFNLYEYSKLTIKDLLKMKKTRKEKLFEKAKNILTEQIDVVDILKNIQDIEKLKFLLLTPNQILLFELLDKPMIFLQGTLQKDKDESRKFMKDSKFINHKDREEKMKKALDYYLELEKKGRDISCLDEKLFSMVENDIKNFRNYFTKKNE